MNMEKQLTKQTRRNEWLINAAALIPPLVILAFILRYGANSPFNDDFYFLDFFRKSAESGLSITDVLSFRVNEHRAVLPLIVECLIWVLSDCNNKIVLIVSWSVWVGCYYLLVHYLKKTHNSGYILIIVAPLFFASKFSFYFFWAQCSLVWSLNLLFTLLSFYCYHIWTIEKKISYICLALVFGVLDSFTSAAGILIWCAYLAAATVQLLLDRKRFVSRYLPGNLALMASGAVCIFLYFSNWAGFITPRPDSLIAVVKGFFSNVLCFALNSDAGGVAPLFGAAIITVIAVSAITLCKKKVIEKYLFEVLMTGYFFGGMLVQSYRVSVSNMMVTQYALMPTMFLIGGILLVMDCISELGLKPRTEICRLAAWGAWILLGIISLLNVDVLVGDANIHLANAYVVQNYRLVPTDLFEQYTTIKVDVSEDSFYSDLKWAESEELFLFGQSREYEYPFDDFYMAEPMDGISAGTETSAGRYAIDFVNGTDPRAGEITVLREDGGFNIDGWALDDTSSCVPSAVYLKMNDKYYLFRQAKRDDVSSALGNDDLQMCGCLAYIPVGDMAPGQYPIKLVVVSADGQRYYEVDICSLNIV